MPAAEVVKQVVPAAELRYFDGGHSCSTSSPTQSPGPIIETFSR
jgi:hypothetical protein